jgi:ubiquinone/menaquinone biosynthesis C-methylase UbiE
VQDAEKKRGHMGEHEQEKYWRGMLVEWYDRMMESQRTDIEYYKKVAEDCKGKILELACGTGRILIPILESGIDIEGMDISKDMLSICQQKMDAKGLTAPLYQMDMATFDTGTQYKMIFCAGGSFRLVVDLDEVMHSLQTIYRHLEPGGMFICDVHNPAVSFRNYKDNTWKLGDSTSNDQGETMWYLNCREYDVIEQVETYRSEYRLFRDKMLVNTGMGEAKLRWYGKYELKYVLEKAGFVNIEMEPAVIFSQKGDMVYRAYRG